MHDSRWRRLFTGLRHRLTAMTYAKTKIRMLTAIAGSLSASPGDVVECDTVLALRLINTGQAEHIDVDRIPDEPESAMTTAPERATKSRAKPRKRRGVKRG